MSKRNLVQQGSENRVTAIRAARRAATALSDASEQLRRAVDEFEATLRAAAEVGCLSQEAWQLLYNRLTDIRQRRNGMEAFELECRVKALMEKAYQELP